MDREQFRFAEDKQRVLLGEDVKTGKQYSRWSTETGLALLTLGVLFVSSVACQTLTPAQKAQKQLATARKDVQSGKVSEAIIAYRQAVQNDPKLAVAHYELGKLYEEHQEYINAFRQLSQAVDLDGSNIDARLRLGNLLLAARKFDDAKQQANAVLAQKKDDPEGLLLLAGSQRGSEDNANARATVDRLLTVDPNNGGGWFLRASLQFQDKQLKDTEYSLRQSVKFAPHAVPAFTALSAFLVQQNRPAEAENVIRGAVADNPQSLAAYYLLANFLWQQKRLPEAEVAFQKIKALGESSPQGRGALARFYAATKRTDLAEKEYQEILQKYPDDVYNKRGLATLYLVTGRPADAENVVKAILKAHPDDGLTLILNGRLEASQGKLEQAALDFQHATRAEPRAALAHYYLATVQLRLGQLSQAESELRTSLDLNPKLMPARTLLSGLEMKSGNLQRSLSDMNQVVASQPKSVGPYVMRSILLTEQGNADQAEKDLMPLLNTFNQPAAQAETYRTLAWIQYHEGKYPETRKYLQRAAELQPQNTDTLYLQALTYLAEKKPDAALSHLQSEVNKYPKWAEGYQIAGEVMLQADRRAQAQAFLRQALTINPQLLSAWLSLGSSFALENNFDGALDAYNHALQIQPKSSLVYLRLGQVHEKRSDWKQAEATYEKALQLDPSNVVAKNNLAWDYAEHGGNIDVALRLAQEAREASPDNPGIADTLGWIYVKKDTLGNAIQLLQESVDKNPRNPTFNYHLGVAYYRAGRKSQAKQFLETAVKLEPNVTEAGDARKLLSSLN